jgi:hypothetical protein
MIKGFGVQGSNNAFGTGFVDFNDGAINTFCWDGTADPLSHGGFAGTGGGLQNVTVWKADRTAYCTTVNVSGATNANPIVLTTLTPHGFPIGAKIGVVVAGVGGNTAANGTHTATILSANTLSIAVAGNGAYTSGGTVKLLGAHNGGRQIYLQAQSAAKRPGEMVFHNVLCAAEGSGGSSWDRGIEVDGSKVTTPGALGVRDLYFSKVRNGGCAEDFMNLYLHYAEHCSFSWFQADAGSAGAPGITIEADCNNVGFSDLVCDGLMLIQDTPAITVNAAVSSGVTTILQVASNPWTVGDTFNARITDAAGMPELNGVWTATSVDATHISIALDSSGLGAYTADSASIQSTSPRDVTIKGRLTQLDITALDCTYNVVNTNGILPDGTSPPATYSYYIKSPQGVITGPNAPAFKLQLENSVLSNVTGEGTTYTVVFNLIKYDRNGDTNGQPLSAHVVLCAGKYQYRARVLLSGLVSGTHSFAIIGFSKNGAATNSTVRVPCTFDGTGYMSIQIDEVIDCAQGDVIRVHVLVSGGVTKTVGIYADVGSGHTAFSGERLPVAA